MIFHVVQECGHNFLSFCHTDGPRDGRTDSFLLTTPPCIQCSAVKKFRM